MKTFKYVLVVLLPLLVVSFAACSSDAAPPDHTVDPADSSVYYGDDSEDAEDPADITVYDEGYSEGYLYGYSDGYSDGYDAGLVEIPDERIFDLVRHFVTCAEDSSSDEEVYSPFEAFQIVSDYISSDLQYFDTRPSEAEYNQAVRSLTHFYLFFYNRCYEDIDY